MRTLTLTAAAIAAVMLSAVVARTQTTQPTDRPTTQPAGTAASQPAGLADPPGRKLTLTLLAVNNKAGRAIETVGAAGRIDWTGGWAIAEGTAKMANNTAQGQAMARRAAYIIAVRNAALLTRGIRIGPAGKVANVAHGQIVARFQLRGIQTASTRQDARAGTVTVRVRVPLWGVAGSADLLKVQPTRRGRRGVIGHGSARYEAIIIDARGSGFRPCLTANVTDPAGTILLSAADLKAAQLRDGAGLRYLTISPRRTSAFGPIQHARSVTAGLGRPEPEIQNTVNKARLNALMLRATTSTPGTLKLDRTSTTRLSATAKPRDLFRKGKVIVVVDPMN